jgi:multidrug efflux pump subunit AcrA (membrane-fusion protein)
MRDALVVNRDALILRPGGISVFVVDQDNTVRQVPVTTGIGSGPLIEVAGDVRPGERVVVRGNERLRPGQAVTVAEG